MVSKAKWGISYFYLVSENGFLHKSKENRLVFVDPLQSHCRRNCVTCTGSWPQPHLPVPLLTAHQPAGRGFVWPAPHHAWQNQPGQPILIVSALRVIWLIFTEVGLDAITTASISSAVAEAALKSAKRGLWGAGTAWRYHLLIWPQSTWKGCTDTR